MQLPSTPASALSARGFITATLRGWGLDALIEVVALLAGELVTNAVVHTHSAVSLVVGRADHAVRVEVHDASPGRPELGMAAGDDEGGRGLALVDALATRWGVDADGAGKSVWFEVATRASDPQAVTGRTPPQCEQRGCTSSGPSGRFPTDS